jgi:hypothetical protein
LSKQLDCHLFEHHAVTSERSPGASGRGAAPAEDARSRPSHRDFSMAGFAVLVESLARPRRLGFLFGLSVSKSVSMNGPGQSSQTDRRNHTMLPLALDAMVRSGKVSEKEGNWR